MSDTLPKVLGGLQPTQRDGRDFKLGNVTKFPSLKELPVFFDLGEKQLVNQIGDFCTGAATCAASALQEGVPLSWKYSMALSKELTGDPNSWGQQIRPAMLTHIKMGAIELNESPYEENDTVSFLRNIKNWPNHLKILARKHMKKSVFFVNGPYDHYDNIRASLWKFRKEKRAVVSGVIWNWNISDEMLDEYKEKGTGHCILYRGFTEKGLIMQNSYGRKAGHNGFHIVGREVVNRNFEHFDGAMFIDINKEEAKFLHENRLPLWMEPLVRLYNIIRSYIKDYAGR